MATLFEVYGDIPLWCFFCWDILCMSIVDYSKTWRLFLNYLL